MMAWSRANTITWKEIDEARFLDMLGIMPPTKQTGYGFLLGEAWTHRTCQRLDLVCAAYAAFIEYDGRFFEASGPMTRAEFGAFDPSLAVPPAEDHNAHVLTYIRMVLPLQFDSLVAGAA